jgi:hypothetical protein
MLEALRQLQTFLSQLDRDVRQSRSRTISRRDIRDNVAAVVDFYFRSVRETWEGQIPQESLAACDTEMQFLLDASHGRTSAVKYRSAISALQRHLSALEKIALLTGGRLRQPSDPTDLRIAATLRSLLLPSAAASYEQAITDLCQESRLSWRGPATDLREALRECLDHLAPDDQVTAAPGYQPEAGTQGPTMKQKVRYVLRARGLSRSAAQAPETAVEAVEEAVGSFVRSVYTRSSLSTHTPTDKGEVLRIRDWVRVALCELLAIHSG